MQMLCLVSFPVASLPLPRCNLLALLFFPGGTSSAGRHATAYGFIELNFDNLSLSSRRNPVVDAYELDLPNQVTWASAVA